MESVTGGGPRLSGCASVVDPTLLFAMSIARMRPKGIRHRLSRAIQNARLAGGENSDVFSVRRIQSQRCEVAGSNNPGTGRESPTCRRCLGKRWAALIIESQ